MEKLSTILLSFLLAAVSFAQDGNPFSKYGYEPRIATLTDGKYVEFHDRDTIVQISRVVYNTMSKEIIGFIEKDTVYSEATLAPDVVSRWLSPDPLAHWEPGWSPYRYGFDNPIMYTDPTGLYEDWVESEDGDIYWDDNATSQATTKEGETYLGKNVLVGTHNRDSDGNEPINSAKFELYLESDKTGPSATIMGNTVPSDISKSGTLAEGLYSAKSGSRAKYVARGDEDLAILINGGKAVPTTFNSPKSSMTEIFFHMGNNYQKSLFDSRGNAYSAGCQTSGSYPGSREAHNSFMNTVGPNFNGSYYLRSRPIKPQLVPFSSDIRGNN